jgi:uncharacterized phage protein gp47/JayE
MSVAAMPYPRPTLSALITQAVQDVTDTQVTDPLTGNVLTGLLQNAVLRVLPTVLAGLTWQLYGYVDFVSLQAIPATATDEFLSAWAALKGVLREDAAAASGTFSIATGCTNGSVLPLGTTISCPLNGLAYLTTADATAAGGAVSVPVLSTTAGEDGNIAAGTALTISGTIAGFPSAGVATAAFTGGADMETDDSLRTRMLRVYASPPQGGDLNDYIEFATAVPGVTRAWVIPHLAGAGTVTVFIMLDNAESAFAGFPQGANGVAANEPRAAAATGDQLTVANAIFTEQPVTALVFVNAPVAQPVNFAIANLGSFNTASGQALITAALANMFLTLGQVGGAVDPTTGDPFVDIDPSDFYAAVSSVAGIGKFTISSPTGPITAATGSLPVLGTVTFSS